MPMATFPFELVSPTRLVHSGEVEEVIVPGAEGEFGVFAQHAPFVSTLRPGILTIKAASGEKRLYVRDGFAEVNPKGLTVLAEVAVPVEEIEAGAMTREIETAEKALAEVKEGPERDKAALRVDQMKSAATALGGAGAARH
jgi:F-type H+-transporting ATPase subunit epsilon